MFKIKLTKAIDSTDTVKITHLYFRLYSNINAALRWVVKYGKDESNISIPLFIRSIINLGVQAPNIIFILSAGRCSFVVYEKYIY